MNIIEKLKAYVTQIRLSDEERSLIEYKRKLNEIHRYLNKIYWRLLFLKKFNVLDEINKNTLSKKIEDIVKTYDNLKAICVINELNKLCELFIKSKISDFSALRRGIKLLGISVESNFENLQLICREIENEEIYKEMCNMIDKINEFKEKYMKILINNLPNEVMYLFIDLIKKKKIKLSEVSEYALIKLKKSNVAPLIALKLEEGRNI